MGSKVGNWSAIGLDRVALVDDDDDDDDSFSGGHGKQLIALIPTLTDTEWSCGLSKVN